MMRTTLVVLCLCFSVAFQQEVSYSGYQVIRAKISTEKQLTNIVESGLDVWSGGSTAYLGINDIMVNSSDLEDLVNLGVDFETIIQDVGNNIEREKQEIRSASLNPAASWFDSYHTYAEIVSFLANVSSSFPNLVRYTPNAGQTVENRAIPVIRIVGGKNPVKKGILLVGGQHAREWIGPATVLYLLEKLVSGYGVNSKITAIVDAVDFTFIPVANVDGYLFTWNGNRLWRKNRRVNAGGSFGVDLNRNWDNHWCKDGGSTVPSSDTYCGTGPFSEPESKTISQVTLAYSPFHGAIDFHSYGQLIMRPYGWSYTYPSNNAVLERVGNGMKAAIQANSGKAYTNQAISQLYLSSGSSADWWVDNAKIPLSYGFEVRDTGTYGFQLPANQIIGSGEEHFAALSVLVDAVLAA